MKTIIRQFVAIFLSMTIIFVSVPSYAVYDPNAKHSKWYVDRLMADPLRKSTVEIKAQRNYPVSTLGADGKPIIQQKVQKSTIKLAPKAANVGKSLIKRTPVGAITQALIGLGISATSWVMDPENNRVKYKDVSNTVLPDDPSNQYYWTADGYGVSMKGKTREALAKSYCDAVGAYRMALETSDNNFNCYDVTGKWTHSVIAVRRLNPNYDPSAPVPDDYKYIPIDQVAQKIIDQADAGEPAAMEVMSNSALDQLEAGLLNDQLEAAAESKIFNEGESDPTDPNAPNPDPDAPTDPNAPNPDAKPFELPPFCSWATKVCDFIDWVQAEPDIAEEDTAVDIDLPDTSAEDTNIDFGGSCPAPFVFNGSIFGNSFSMTLLDTAMLCDFLSTYVKYPVYAVSSLYALYIFGGRKDV